MDGADNRTDGADDAGAEHALNTELLNAELPDKRFDGPDYLAWLYDENPEGGGVYEGVDEDGRRMAHYALIPQKWRNAGGPAPVYFSLNAVTRSGAQRKGYFVQIGHRIYERARVDGAKGILAVPNEKSTPGALKYLGYRFLGPLPVRVLAPLGSAKRFDSHLVDEAWLASDEFAAIAHDVERPAASGWTQAWTPEQLRWRLTQPRAGYVVHVSDDLVAVSVPHQFLGITFAVIVKFLPRGDLAVGQTVSSRGAVAAACRYHRAPAAVYAGFNAHVRLRGIRPPRRIQPAPLNLLFRSLSDEVPQETFALDTYEFLDFDAY
jgi:hypothetical protein